VVIAANLKRKLHRFMNTFTAWQVGVLRGLDAAMFLKDRHRQSEVSVNDLRTNVSTVIGWNNGATFIQA
jgi:hypothetical protein